MGNVFKEIAQLIIQDLQAQGIHTNNMRAMPAASMGTRSGMGNEFGGDDGGMGTIKIGSNYHDEKP